MSSQGVHQHCAGNGHSMGTRRAEEGGGEMRLIWEWDGDSVCYASLSVVRLGR
jgi:hypothetical protein